MYKDLSVCRIKTLRKLIVQWSIYNIIIHIQSDQKNILLFTCYHARLIVLFKYTLFREKIFTEYQDEISGGFKRRKSYA